MAALFCLFSTKSKWQESIEKYKNYINTTKEADIKRFGYTLLFLAQQLL